MTGAGAVSYLELLYARTAVFERGPGIITSRRTKQKSNSPYWHALQKAIFFYPITFRPMKKQFLKHTLDMC
jgi:hypothetical protein